MSAQPWPSELQAVAASALIASHPHHGWRLTADADGTLVLALNGGGEFHDGSWIIEPNGHIVSA